VFLVSDNGHHPNVIYPLFLDRGRRHMKEGRAVPRLRRKTNSSWLNYILHVHWVTLMCQTSTGLDVWQVVRRVLYIRPGRLR
jgi:hypothetical protein